MTAEQKIRQAFNNGMVTLGVAKPITVQHNGRTQQFMARQDRVVRNGRAHSVIHLMVVRRGKLLSSLPEGWILEKYKLTGKNQLVEEGIPQSISEQEAESFLANFRAIEPLPKEPSHDNQ